MEMLYFTDICVADETRIPLEEIREMQSQFNCNLHGEPESETWFDADELPEHITIVDEVELYARDEET
jgi:hypothetical protein